MKRQVFALALTIVVGMFVGFVPTVHAGIFSDVSAWYKDRDEFSAHSRNVSSAVRVVYNERESLTSFNNAALNLVNAYSTVKNGAVPDVSKLLTIGQSITTLVNDYQKLSPKFSTLYNQVKPDITYFQAKLGENASATPTIKQAALTDSKIAAMSRVGGLARVWSSIKESPSNIFKWGKLSEEYSYAKARDAYALKTVQMAIEMQNFYSVASFHVEQLLGIKNEIAKLTGGDLSAILGIGSTIQKVTGAKTDVDALGEVAKKAPGMFQTRFNELQTYQKDYVDSYKSYSTKYGDPDADIRKAVQKATTAASAPTPSASATAPQAPRGNGGGSVTVAPIEPGASIQNKSNKPALATPPQVANPRGFDFSKSMEEYKRLYQEYVTMVSDPGITDQSKIEANKKLQDAYKLMNSLKPANR
ncbi:MAG: hypothetical protein WA705_03585 [Candidatus Ozemobacteraceae bacterium]